MIMDILSYTQSVEFGIIACLKVSENIDKEHISLSFAFLFIHLILFTSLTVPNQLKYE